MPTWLFSLNFFIATLLFITWAFTTFGQPDVQVDKTDHSFPFAFNEQDLTK